MDRAHAPGEVTLIEAQQRPPSLLPLAGLRALQHATVVIADPQTHPTLLAHASAAALELRAWNTEAVEVTQAHAHAGARVVCLVSALDDAAGLRASGVEVRCVPGVGAHGPLGPLDGRRILVTRPRPAADVQRTRFEALGADAVALPCLEILPPEDVATFDDAVRAVHDYDGLIVSSRAGVEALRASLTRSDLDIRVLAHRHVVAVGRATADACASIGLRPDIVPSAPRSEGIAAALRDRDLLGGRWLHVRARDGRETLDEAITPAGGTYRLATGYRAERPTPPPGVVPWLRDGAHVICLHSGRTGRHLRATLAEHGLLALLDRAQVVSAGPVTTEALQEQGFEVAATASSPGDDGMLQAVSGLA